MNDIEKLFGKVPVIEFNGQKVEVPELTVEETLDLAVDSSEHPEERPRIIKELLLRRLRKAFPGSSDEKILSLPQSFLNALNTEK